MVAVLPRDVLAGVCRSTQIQMGIYAKTFEFGLCCLTNVGNHQSLATCRSPVGSSKASSTVKQSVPDSLPTKSGPSSKIPDVEAVLKVNHPDKTCHGEFCCTDESPVLLHLVIIVPAGNKVDKGELLVRHSPQQN